MTALTADEQFFYDNAGWSHHPDKETSENGHRRSARELAEAEAYARAKNWNCTWEPDPDPWDGDVPYDGPLWGATLRDDKGNILASLWSIAVEHEGDPYARVVNAQLALEAMDEAMKVDALVGAAEASSRVSDALDEAVHEAMSGRASDINNKGTAAQIDWLIDKYGFDAVQKIVQEAK